MKSLRRPESRSNGISNFTQILRQAQSVCSQLKKYKRYSSRKFRTIFMFERLQGLYWFSLVLNLCKQRRILNNGWGKTKWNYCWVYGNIKIRFLLSNPLSGIQKNILRKSFYGTIEMPMRSLIMMTLKMVDVWSTKRKKSNVCIYWNI